MCAYVGPALFIESIYPGPDPELSLSNPHIQTYVPHNHVLYLPFPKRYFRRSKSDEAKDWVPEKLVFNSQKEQEVFLFNKMFTRALGPTQSPTELAQGLERHGDSVQCDLMSGLVEIDFDRMFRTLLSPPSRM